VCVHVDRKGMLSVFDGMLEYLLGDGSRRLEAFEGEFTLGVIG